MKTILFIMLALSFSVHAAWNNPTSFAQEQKIIKDNVFKYYPGYEIAGDYRKLYDFSDYQEIEKKSSYIFFDMNQDGGQDLAIILEQIECEDQTITKLEECQFIVSVNRVVAIFFGQWNGSYKRVGYNRSAMLEKGDGGVAAAYADPLLPIGVNQNDNTLEIAFWGGSNTKWAFQFNIKYRRVQGKGYGFYLVRKDVMSQEISPEGERVLLTEYNQTYDYEKNVVFQTIETFDTETGETTFKGYDSFMEELELKSFSFLGPADFFTEWY